MRPDDALPFDVRAWTYDELVREGMPLILAHAPEWTDHNPSDPGITMVELLAYFSEILAYRALRITPDARLAFLRLLQPSGWTDWETLLGGPSRDVDGAIRERVAGLAQPELAATPSDMERLALASASRHLDQLSPADIVRDLRVACIAGDTLRHLPGGPGPDVQAAGDMGIVLAVEPALPPRELQTLCDRVKRDLAPACLLTSDVWVRDAIAVRVRVAGSIVFKPGADPAAVIDAIDKGLSQRFGRGRKANSSPFGGIIHLAEIAGIIDRSDGVDYVENLVVHRIATHAGVDEPGDVRPRLGIRVGVYAKLGIDARFGGDAGAPAKRFGFGPDGEAQSVRLQAWETADIRLARDRIELHAGVDHDD